MGVRGRDALAGISRNGRSRIGTSDIRKRGPDPELIQVERPCPGVLL